MKLLAISGGPDSMFLLDQYKKNKKIVVCHINYNKRKNSNKDEKIVRDFCKKYNLLIEVLSVQNSSKGNFQSWARKIRYDFFKKIYDKYNCKKILMAHHKDDFIETALMQINSNRNPRYFGIKKKNIINEMKIERPYIDLFWKKDIFKIVNKKNIPYVEDSTNLEDIFERNKIRKKLNNKTLIEKQSIYKWFIMSNKILKKKFKKVDNLYKNWKKYEFDLKLFRKIKYKDELVFIFVNENFKNVKLSSKKISNLTKFFKSETGGKNFKLNDKNFISKKNSKIIFF